MGWSLSPSALTWVLAAATLFIGLAAFISGYLVLTLLIAVGAEQFNLSTGTAKKLWYLINTIGDYDLAVLDEPFNGVDADSIGVIANELRQFAGRGTAVLIAHALTNDVVPDRAIDVRELAGRL
ncbi:MAG TPA: hypothetical protein VJQ61_05520 [Sinomonas sp.]|nr:hypothetical protein [Sinomonas sp.]